MSTRHKVLWSFVIVIFLAGCTGLNSPVACNVQMGSHSAVTPVARQECDWWIPRHKNILERNRQGNVSVIFIGDSITHRWETVGRKVWDEKIEPLGAVNMGFSGDRTERTLWRLENGEIDGIAPKLAVIMIGTNNVLPNSAEEIADGINAIICKVRRKLPKTKILLLSIFPRGSYEQRKIKGSEATMNPLWEKNNRASILASASAEDDMVYYLDINDVFLNDKGVLTREVMPDLLHPNEKGYQLWCKAMMSMIKQLMQED